MVWGTCRLQDTGPGLRLRSSIQAPSPFSWPPACSSDSDTPMDKTFGATAIVAASLVILFVLPKNYFIPATLVATSVMIAVALFVRRHDRVAPPTARQVVLGFL